MSISIKMLGELQVIYDNQLLHLPASKLTRALLIYLLLNNRPQRREHLCNLLWADTKDPRGALRWSLSKLRALLNSDIEYVVTDKDYVSINKTNLEIDVNSLSGQAALQHCSLNELNRLSEQLALPLLDGMDLHNYPEYQNWLTAKRQQLVQLRHKVLDQIATAKRHISASQQTGNSSAVSGRMMPTPPVNISYCSSADGTQIAYAAEGTGLSLVKPPAFLNHLQYDWHSPVWGRIYHQLSAHLKLIRYDDRGTGMSESNVSDISSSNLAEDLEAVIKASNLDKFALLGISNGAALSIDYAARHPERVSHLILFSSYAAGWRADGDLQLRDKLDAIIALAETGWEQSNPAFRQFFSMTLVPEASQQELNWLNEYLLLAANAKNAAAIMSACADLDVRDKLQQIKVPTLVIHSLGDKTIPPLSGREIAASIPGAEFIGLNSTSHLLLEREPSAQQFIDIVRDFICRH